MPGCVWAVTIPPVEFQCRLQVRVFQWHSSVGQFQLSFFQWCSSVPCKYSLCCPVVSQCTLGQPVAFQWHSSVHWTSQCTLVNCLRVRNGANIDPDLCSHMASLSHNELTYLLVNYLYAVVGSLLFLSSTY